MTLRDLDIKIDLEVNSSGLAQVNRQIDQFVNKVKKIDDEINVKIDVDAVDAMAELHRLEAQLQRIERHTIDVDVDSAAAMAQLAALQAQLALLNGQRINPNIGGGFGGGGIGMLGASPAGLALKGYMFTMIEQLIPVFIGAIGTAGYAIGALANGTVALGSAIASAGIGMGAFGLVAFTTISKLYDENAKLTQSQKELKEHIDSLSYSYGVMEKSAQPLVYDTIGKGVNTIKTAIHMMTPIVDDAAIAIGGLFHDLNRSLQGERMTEFFDYIERSTGPMINNIGTGLGYALQGVANTMVALEPLTNWMAQGFEDMFKRFADWSAIQKDTDGFADFINNTKDALSAIGDITGGAYEGVRDFFGAFEFTAVDGLEWLGDKMQDFAKWSSDLDNNQGFQDMLAQIAHDGPIIAQTLGEAADAIERLYDLLKNPYDNFTEGLFGEGGAWGWTGERMNLDTAFEGFKLENVFKPGGALNAAFPDLDWSAMLGLDKLGDTISNLDIGGWLSTAASNAGEWWGGIREGLSGMFEDAFASASEWLGGIGESVSGWFSGLDIGGSISASLGAINWSDFIPSFTWPSIPILDWQSVLPSFSWPSLPSLDWSSILPSFSWPSIPTLSWSNFINRFNWPSLPSFSWQSFIDRFKWPSLPSFSWSGFIDKFKWPTLPKFSWPKVSVSDLLGKVGRIGSGIAEKVGFNTGIGNVPYDMQTTIHKGEAVIERDKAQELRNAGVLQGDGRYPKVDLSIPQSTNNTSSFVTTTSQSSQVVNVGGVQVHVHSNSDDGTEVANIVAERLSQMFSDLNIVMPMTREG